MTISFTTSLIFIVCQFRISFWCWFYFALNRSTSLRLTSLRLTSLRFEFEKVSLHFALTSLRIPIRNPNQLMSSPSSIQTSNMLNSWRNASLSEPNCTQFEPRYVCITSASQLRSRVLILPQKRNRTQTAVTLSSISNPKTSNERFCPNT